MFLFKVYWKYKKFSICLNEIEEGERDKREKKKKKSVLVTYTAQSLQQTVFKTEISTSCFPTGRKS